jgi:hypothetical protein
MAYQVNNFNGGFLVNVADGTIDTTTDLRFVGKNYAGYGEIQNENFLHLMENFANTTAPPKAVAGQIWYDSANKKLRYYDGTQFKVAAGAQVSSTAPIGSSTGDFWWDTSTKQLYAWNGTDYTLVGPISTPELGTSLINAAVVKDTVSTPHTILKVITDDKVVAIFSKDEFTIDNTQNPVTDFTFIKKGLTLAKSQTGVSTDNYVMWGTAQNANLLGGFGADQFLRVGDNSFISEVAFGDPGFTVGVGGGTTDAPLGDLRIQVQNDINAIIENRLGNPIIFRITVTPTSDERDVAVIRNDGVVPGNDNAYTLGTALSRWNNVYSTSFTGNLVGSVTGNTTGNHTGNILASDTTILINTTTKQIGYDQASIRGVLTGSLVGNVQGNADNAGKLNNLETSVSVSSTGALTIPVRDASGNITANQFIGISSNTNKIFLDRSNIVADPAWSDSAVNTQYRTARLTATAYSIAARDNSGNITATLFDGTATAAQYADLAEKYLADKQYEPGTVVSVCDHPEHEVEACSWGQRAIGVVSTNPAFMMNKDLEGGTYIALKGRVPCKVTGAIKKGQRLIAGNNGTAMAGISHSNDVFGIALETNSDVGVKTIEVLVL